MVLRTYPESFGVIAQNTVGEDIFSNSIFRKGDYKSCMQYNYTTVLTFDQRYFRLGTKKIFGKKFIIKSL